MDETEENIVFDDETLDLADGDLDGKRFKLVGVRLRLVAQLIVEDTTAGADDFTHHLDDRVVTLLTHDQMLPLHEVAFLGELANDPNMGFKIDTSIHDLALAPNESLSERVNEIADSFDEMVEIDVPVTVEYHKEDVLTVKVPKGALLRAAKADADRTGDESNSSSINQLVYAHNDVEDLYDAQNMRISPDVLCQVTHPRAVKSVSDPDTNEKFREITKRKVSKR
jgi:hypothetical protein